MGNISTHVHENNLYPQVDQSKCLAYLSKSIDIPDNFNVNLDPPYSYQVDMTLIIHLFMTIYMKGTH